MITRKSVMLFGAASVLFAQTPAPILAARVAEFRVPGDPNRNGVSAAGLLTDGGVLLVESVSGRAVIVEPTGRVRCEVRARTGASDFSGTPSIWAYAGIAAIVDKTDAKTGRRA